LQVSYNKLTGLPDEIRNCVSLKKLHVSHNELTQLPGAVCELANLQELDFSSNHIKVRARPSGGFDLIWVHVWAHAYVKKDRM